jgi:hypothetical protein
MGKKTKEVTDLRMALERIIQQRMLRLNEYEIISEQLVMSLQVEREKQESKKTIEADLDAMLATLKAQIDDKKYSKDKLLIDQEQLEKELAVLQEDLKIEQDATVPSPVGIPVESNYIAFVIDTSGSMRDSSGYLFSYVVLKLADTLASYPEVKGIQVLDANGNFILGRGARSRWLRDGPETRKSIVNAVRFYPGNSESNPVPGIERAIRLLAEPNNKEMKMGVYVFADDFHGKTAPVFTRIAKMNKDKNGDRIVRINAVGFPHRINGMLNLGSSGLKFANLMRELTYEHGGAFVAVRLKGIHFQQYSPSPFPEKKQEVPKTVIFER